MTHNFENTESWEYKANTRIIGKNLESLLHWKYWNDLVWIYAIHSFLSLLFQFIATTCFRKNIL